MRIIKSCHQKPLCVYASEKKKKEKMMRTIPRQGGNHLLDFTYSLFKHRLSLGCHHIITPSLLTGNVTDSVGIRENKPRCECASIQVILVDREASAQSTSADAIQFRKRNLKTYRAFDRLPQSNARTVLTSKKYAGTLRFMMM